MVCYSRKSEIVLLMKIYINHCRENRSDIASLFKLVETTKIRIGRDQSFLRKFFRNEISETYSVVEKREIFLYFLEFLKKDNKLDSKINASFMIICPLIINSYKKGELNEVINNEAIKNFTDFIRYINGQRAYSHSRLDIEILQLSSLLMTFMTDQFQEHKKSLLQFGWHFLKILDDKILKHFAYIFTCKFIKIFGIPDDMVLQIYVALLKGQEEMGQHDYEISALSKKALNILIPFLSQKVWGAT